MPEKIGGGSAQGFAMQLDEGEFARAINGQEEIQPAFRSLPLGARRAPLFLNQWQTILRSSDQWRTMARSIWNKPMG